MTLERDIETINEYTQWKAVRQDTSPEAFVRDRAQQAAYERLSGAIAWMDGYFDDDVDGKVVKDWIGGTDMLEASDMENLYKILNGEDI